MAGLFVGAVRYADDVFLIAPTRSAMQRMLLKVENFAADSNVVFSTDPVPSKSKSKCIYIGVIPCQLTHFFGLRQESAK